MNSRVRVRMPTWADRLRAVVAAGALLLLLAANLSACVAAEHAKLGASRIEVAGKQALLVASYAYAAAARDAAARIRAGRMTEAEAARAQALGGRVRDALVAAHDVADGFSRARRIEEALATTAELVAIVEEDRP